MAETAYATTTRLPVPVLWDFVQDMDHWARFVAGYQGHEKRSDTESVWTLKGDLGVMSRTLTFQVRIIEWAGPTRVRFQLTGVNEPMAGEGCFTLEPVAGDAGAAAPAANGAAAPPRPGAVMRALERLVRRVLALLRGRVERDAPAAAGAALSRMTFELRLEPGGPMAPMIDAMIRPLLRPAAEDLATRILAHLESREGGAR